MRSDLFGICLLVTLVLGAGSAVAIDGELGACNVCTCANGEVACGEVATDVLEEQGVCASLCAGIGSSGTSGPKLVEAPCSELPPCGTVGAPAAGPLWLGAGAIGLLSLGAFGVRRARRRGV